MICTSHSKRQQAEGNFFRPLGQRFCRGDGGVHVKAERSCTHCRHILLAIIPRHFLAVQKMSELPQKLEEHRAKRAKVQLRSTALRTLGPEPHL